MYVTHIFIVWLSMKLF